MHSDIVIFGGGVAGLWLLDELHRQGHSALLLEAGDLGSGQTVVSQGIIHGGLKYTLQGLLTRSAENIREMPLLWRDCLAGRRAPDLSRTRVRSNFCYLWRTESLSSRLGMIGAKIGLRVAPTTLSDDEIPEVLRGCPGTVARLDEQVISPASLVEALAAPHRDRILRVDFDKGVEFECTRPGHVEAIRLCRPDGADGGGDGALVLRPLVVVFTAGAGNAALREHVGLSADAMQLRPLHMVLLRGDLPQFSGHCVDGAKTRVTITSDADSAGRPVWQVGGQIAEEGVGMTRDQLVERAKSELADVLPSLDLAEAEWGTYVADRAEGRMPRNARPETVQVLRDGNCITAWPTKLVLAPVLAGEIVAGIGAATIGSRAAASIPPDWPRPDVALPPWEIATNWQKLSARRATG